MRYQAILKPLRVALAAVFFVSITLLFLNLGGVVRMLAGWMAKLQFLPAVLALNVGVIAAIVILTLVFGRIYCSVICPLGVFQDAVSHVGALSRKRRTHGRPFTYRKELGWLRYGVWALFVAALLLGINSLVAVLAPYSAYGRMVRSIVSPAALSPTLIVAAVSLLVVVLLSWFGGRSYCNAVCPVGTTLSFFSRFALLRPVIDADKCKNCKLCENNCKASCINIADHKIDYSRCVDCFDCIGKCRFDALHYKFAYAPKKPVSPESTSDSGPDAGRRAFLSGAVLFAGAAALNAQKRGIDGGLAAIEDKVVPERATPIVPPGSLGIRNLTSHCTACQLCVSQCPNGVLRPSSSLDRLMQPESSYENGWCRPECTVCSEVCPAGAIIRIDRSEKTSIQVGVAVWVKENCLPYAEGVSCGNCARHCPSGAIIMVPSDPEDEGSVKVPAVDESRCIGCGACEYLCPSRPHSAIYVEGLQEHKTV